MEANEKIRPLHAEQKGEAKSKTPQKSPEQLLAETRKDMGKVGLFISILTVILLVIFFYSINQNVSGLRGEVDELATLQGEVDEVQGQVADVEKSVSGLNNDVNSLGGKFGDLSSGFSKIDNHVNDLQGKFADLNGKVGNMGQKIVELEKLPETTKAMILSNIIAEMSRKASYLSEQVGTEQQQNLLEARKLLNQVQQGLNK